MISIDFDKFSLFYKNHIEQHLIDFEKERIEILKKYRKTSVILFKAIPTAILLYALFLLIPEGFLPNYMLPFVIVSPVIIAFIIIIRAGVLQYDTDEQKSKSLQRLKRKVYTRLFNYLELNYNTYPSSEFNNYKDAVLKHLPENKEKYFYFMNFEDEISGEFKGINFKLCDATIIKRYVKLYYKHGGGPVEVWLFQGLMLAAKLNKPFRTETIIKTDSFKDFKTRKNIIKLEDEEFNKKFKVLADDEVESRYLLTTSFMERLKNFHKSKKDKTIIFFDNKCSDSKNMFILTNTGKDNFEIPLNKTLLNEKIYYNLLKELVDMLEIAVALKLGQNIGL